MVTTKSYTFNNVTGNHTISAEFANMTYSVLIYASSGNTNKGQVRYKINSGNWTTISNLSTQTTVTVNSGDRITVEAVNFVSGYRFKRWHITYPDAGEDEYTATNPYQYTVTENVEFAIEFEAIPTYTITATAGVGGTITPSGSVTVQEGGNQTFQITANAGYVISRILVDGSPIAL